MSEKKILVVDDDPAVRRLLRRCLEGDGFSVVEVATEHEVLSALARENIDLITLDLGLGEESGFAVVRSVRLVSDVPIIMVTGKDDMIDRVVGLELGADDYITKPFHVREVLARVRSVLRRYKGQGDLSGADEKGHGETEGASYRFDGLTAHTDRMELLDREGNIAELTSGDFKLLQAFLERPKRILSRDKIMDIVSGANWTPLDRTIDNQVARLRKKIELDPAKPRLIKTVRGVGYTFAADVERL